MFEFKMDEYYNRYYQFKETLSNNQTLDLRFWIHKDDIIYFFVSLKVYSKRKHNTDLKCTGKVGLEALLLTKLSIELFIEFLLTEKDCYRDRDIKIIVHWDDSKRQRVYYRGLKSLGFEYEYLLYFDDIARKFLTKTIPAKV